MNNVNVKVKGERGIARAERGRFFLSSILHPPSSFFLLLSAFCIPHSAFLHAQSSTNAHAHVHDEEVLPPPGIPATFPTGAYTFAMRLPPGTDCTARVRGMAGGAKKNPADPPPPAAMTVERSFREGISSSRVTRARGGSQTIYYLNGVCAYFDPRQGINIDTVLRGHEEASLRKFDFPELSWAGPKTRQPDPKVPEGAPPIQLYKLADPDLGHVMLVVDAVSKYPLRYIEEGISEWTYSYKKSDAPIVMPPELQEAFKPQPPSQANEDQEQ